MRQTPLANPFKFRVNIRPVKIVYFVMKDSPALLLELVRLTCTQWGGIRHLIVPLDADLSIPTLYEAFLQLHEPDRYVAYIDFETHDYNEVANSIHSQLRKIFPHRYLTPQYGVTFHKYDDTAYILGMIPDSTAKSSLLSVPSIVSSEAELLSAILFGQIYPSQEQDYQDFITTNPQTIQVGTEPFWLKQMEIEPFSSILNLTSYQIFAYNVTGGWFDNFDHFDLIISNSVEDYSFFWNMRALREGLRFQGQKEAIRRTICVPAQLLDISGSLDVLFELIKQKLFKPGRRANLDIRLYCFNQEVREKTEFVLSLSSLVIPFADKTNDKTHQTSQAIEDRPLTYIFSKINIPNQYLESVAWSLPIISNLYYGENEIRFEPPEKYFNRYGGAVAVDLECGVWSRYPKAHLVASEIEPNCWFSKYGVSMVMTHLSSAPTFIRFKLPDERETLKLFFRENDYTIVSTKVDQYSNALIDLVDDLQGIKIFASKHCYSILDILALKSTKKVAQRIVKELNLPESRVEEISQVFHDLELPEELKDIPRTFSQLFSDKRIDLSKQELFGLLEKLTKAQILKRGFYLECPNCGNTEWYPLNSIDELLVCSGCTSQFALPVHDGQEEIHWRYRLNNIVNRAMDQDVLVGLLAAYHLTKEQNISCFGYGIKLKQNDKDIGDLDFVYVTNQEIHAGECKAGTRLSEKDFKLAEHAVKLKMTSFCFATVKRFDDETLTKIEEMRKALQAENNATEIKVLSSVELLGDPLA